MKCLVAGLGLAGLFAICTASVAAPLTFTYDCTIDGSAQGGLGTNRCAGGPVIAQVEISDSGLDYSYLTGSSDILIVKARLQFYDPDPPGNLDPYGYQLDAVWLNIDELLLGSGSGNTAATGTSGIAWNDGSGGGNNDFNYIWFARNSSFSSGTTTQIRVGAQSTEASSWKNFDLGLCSEGQSPADCALPLPVLAANQDPATEPWVTLGYLNSGNLYNLKPEDFDFLTTNTNDPGMVNYSPCGPVLGEMASVIKIDPSATSSLFDATCLSGSGYGPRYGAAEGGGVPPQEQIPEPGTLSLLGLAILGLGGMLHISRRRQARV